MLRAVPNQRVVTAPGRARYRGRTRRRGDYETRRGEYPVIAGYRRATDRDRTPARRVGTTRGDYPPDARLAPGRSRAGARSGLPEASPLKGARDDSGQGSRPARARAAGRFDSDTSLQLRALRAGRSRVARPKGRRPHRERCESRPAGGKRGLRIVLPETEPRQPGTRGRSWRHDASTATHAVHFCDVRLGERNLLFNLVLYNAFVDAWTRAVAGSARSLRGCENRTRRGTS